MSETQNTPDAWSRLWQTIEHLLSVLLRVLFVVVAAVLLAAGVYFGAPWVYRQVIHPVQSSVTQLALLQRQVDENNAQWAEDFGAQQQRITDLESQLADQGERIASLESELSRVDEALTEQQTTLDELSSAVTAISGDYASLDEVDTLRDEFVILQEQVTLAEQVTAQIAALEHRIILVQTWQEILKTHLYLTEGNVGDAETTLALAMTHLSQAAALGPESEKEREAITTIQTHLTRAASRLREQPIIAAQDLESAWYELGALITPSPEQ
jgi:septal ring factor EnvC (AmiA/AmiB activator)